MDPISNLKEQLELANTIAECDHSDCECLHNGSRLADLVLALDEWIRKGGFSPWTVST